MTPPDVPACCGRSARIRRQRNRRGGCLAFLPLGGRANDGRHRWRRHRQHPPGGRHGACDLHELTRTDTKVQGHTRAPAAGRMTRRCRRRWSGWITTRPRPAPRPMSSTPQPSCRLHRAGPCKTPTELWGVQCSRAEFRRGHLGGPTRPISPPSVPTAMGGHVIFWHPLSALARLPRPPPGRAETRRRWVVTLWGEGSAA